MLKNTLTRSCIVKKISRDVGISTTESLEILESIFDNISEALVQERKVKLSSFGSFEVKRQVERMGCNPKTGELAVIKERNTVKFKPSTQMKERIKKTYNETL